MRAMLAAPRRKYEALSAAAVGGLKHWRFSEAAGTTAADHYGGASLTHTGTVAVAPFYEADGTTVGSGRNYSSNVSTSTATSTHRTQMRIENISVEVTCSFSVLSGDHGIFGMASTASASAADNTLFAFIARADGSLRVQWHSGTLVSNSITTPAGVVTAGRTYALAVRRWFFGSAVRVDFFVNGALVYRGAGTVAAVPTGGTSANWRAGNVKSSDFIALSGVIYEIRVMSDTTGFGSGNVLRPIDFFRNDAARLLQAFDTSKIVKSLAYNAFARVLVLNPANASAGFRDDGSFEDLDGFEKSTEAVHFNFRHNIVEAVDIEEDIDGEGQTATFTCAREYYDWRYSPLIDTSAVTVNVGERVFDLAREVRIEIAIVPQDVAREDVLPHEWSTAFEGFISSVDFGSNVMSISCRDRVAPVQWTFCRPLASNSFKEMTYGADPGGVSIETVLQQIINDHEPATGYKGGKPIVYTPTSPSWNLRKRNIGFEPVADALNAKVTQIGWVLRYKWDDASKAFRYTLFRPERVSPVSMRAFAVDEYVKLSAAALNEDTIRNVAEVVYGDVASSDNINAPPRTRVVVADSVSIAAYGERFCQITESSTSQIDTATEATALATAVISDLAQPKALITLDLRGFPWAELSDYYTVNSRDHFDTSQDFAVVKIRSHYGNDEHTTSLSLRGKPTGRVDWWLGNMIAQPGLAPYAPFAPIAELPAVTTDALAGAIKVRWVWPAAVRSSAFDLAEVHMTTALGAWTPSSLTLKGVTRGDQMVIADMYPGVTQQVKVIYRDRNNNVTAAAVGANVTPRQMLRTAHVRARRASNQVVTSSTIVTVLFNVEDADPFSRYSAGAYTALTAGLVDFDIRLFCDSAAKPSAPCRAYVYVNGVVRVTGDTILTSAGAAPNRAQLALRTGVQVAAGDVVTVRVYIEGNSGSAVLTDANNTRGWFTPLTED